MKHAKYLLLLALCLALTACGPKPAASSGGSTSSGSGASSSAPPGLSAPHRQGEDLSRQPQQGKHPA